MQTYLVGRRTNIISDNEYVCKHQFFLFFNIEFAKKEILFSAKMEGMESDSPPYKSGFVAVMGRPNVGKSTLINRLLGTKIAAVSPWPQTTRKRQMGILTLEEAQIIFVDTPGVHHPLHKLGKHMNEEAAEVLEECDLGLFLVDATEMPGDEDRLLVNLLTSLNRPIPVLMALNKTDLVDSETLAAHLAAYEELIPQAEALPISATEGLNIDRLVEELVARLPEGAPFFPRRTDHRPVRTGDRGRPDPGSRPQPPAR
jgi:GTPase